MSVEVEVKRRLGRQATHLKLLVAHAGQNGDEVPLAGEDAKVECRTAQPRTGRTKQKHEHEEGKAAQCEPSRSGPDWRTVPEGEQHTAKVVPVVGLGRGAEEVSSPLISRATSGATLGPGVSAGTRESQPVSTACESETAYQH